MEESGTMTLVDVLKICVNMLGEINVPAKYEEQITRPISQVMSNLNLCIEAEEARLAEAEKQETDHPEEPAREEGADCEA